MIEEKTHPYTEDEILNFSSRYMSIKIDETANLLAKSEVFKIPIGQPDLNNINWNGGTFNTPKSEMLVYDLDMSRDRTLTVQQKLAVAILEALKDNDLQLKDLRTGKIRFKICRLEIYEWDVEILDKNFEIREESKSTNEIDSLLPPVPPMENNEIDSEKLKFGIFKILKDNNARSLKEIQKEFPEILNSRISEVLDEMAFMDRKIARFEDNGELIYRIPG